MRYLLLFACLLLAINGRAQNSSTTDTVRQKAAYNYDEVQKAPAPGYELPKFLAKNMRYPDSALKYRVEGRVVVKFIVNEDGHISGAEMKKGIGAGCDKEAIRIVNKMPAWIPGEKDGKPVKVYFVLPLVFKLD